MNVLRIEIESCSSRDPECLIVGEFFYSSFQKQFQILFFLNTLRDLSLHAFRAAVWDFLILGSILIVYCFGIL